MLRQCLLFLSLAGTGLVGCNERPASSAQPKETAIAAGEIGSHLPEFSVKDLQGREISSADLRGKVVLIDFLGHVVPAVQKRDAGLSETGGPLWFSRIRGCWLQIRHHDGYGRPALFAKKLGVRYPLVIAADDLKQKFGGIEGLPTTMLYDRQGILRKKVIGFEYTDVMESAVSPLL